MSDASKKSEHIPIETTACYNFHHLVKKVKQQIWDNHQGTTQEERQELIYQYQKKFTINGQTFEYASQTNKYGGARWFVKCPKCGKNRFKLYLPKKETGREQLYLCRECHKLKNLSAMLGATKKYTKIYKPLKMLEKLKKAILTKKMTPEKAKPRLDAYDEIEMELAMSPEYRLWKFQQRHKGKI